jgi:acyl-coenzyme A synthetase/AMP-(fatty) acid ligase
MADLPEYFNFTKDVMERWAKERPSAIALWWIDEQGKEEKITFQELQSQFSRAAHFFKHCGIQKGDRVMIMLPRLPEWWIIMLGLIRIGAIPIPCTTLLTSKDISYRLETAKISAVIMDMDAAVKVNNFQGVRILVRGEKQDWKNFGDGIKDQSNVFEGESTRSTDPGVIFFTSATTGQPKMVLHTQTSYALGHRATGQLWLDLKPDDVIWNMSDTGWAKAAWSSFYGPWQMGACIFTVDSRGKFDAQATLKVLTDHPITVWCAPPTALRLIVRENLKSCKFPHLRHTVSAGEPLNPEVISTWKSGTGLTLYEGYGQTETVILIGNFRSQNREVRPGSMGSPAPGFEIALLDPGLKEVADGEEGEIAIRVKPTRPIGLFQEYWNNEEQNTARFRGDWYLTGDRASKDKDGYYWFIGRADDVIKSSGYRIGPFEVESALIEHSAVLEAAVVGKADEIRGAIVKAFIVLRKGNEPTEALKLELQEHCKRVTAPYKYPREIEFLTELPKTISGKIRRVELRNRG